MASILDPPMTLLGQPSFRPRPVAPRVSPTPSTLPPPSWPSEDELETSSSESLPSLRRGKARAVDPPGSVLLEGTSQRPPRFFRLVKDGVPTGPRLSVGVVGELMSSYKWSRRVLADPCFDDDMLSDVWRSSDNEELRKRAAAGDVAFCD